MEKQPLILIVDDNLNFVRRIVGILEEAGTSERNISVASDYEEAKRIFFGERHEVVLLDINLPGRNGIDFLRLIRSNDQETKVIMITNHADMYYKRQCLELGASHFLDKSAEFSQLPSLLRKTMAEKRSA